MHLAYEVLPYQVLQVMSLRLVKEMMEALLKEVPSHEDTRPPSLAPYTRTSIPSYTQTLHDAHGTPNPEPQPATAPRRTRKTG